MKKLLVCHYCKVPLKIIGHNARFRCMCDDDVRAICLNDENNTQNVEYLLVSEHERSLSELFIKEFLTSSIKSVEYKKYERHRT